MSVLRLAYRHCNQLRPRYVRHLEVEAIARQARAQLVDARTDALPLAVLSDISELKINGIGFALWVSTEQAVHDPAGEPVLGICEYDAGVPDAAMISVSPVGESAGEELVLSTLAHELGHATFDVPGWIVEANQGPDLFGDRAGAAPTAYRTVTRNRAHLNRPWSGGDAGVEPERTGGPAIGSPEYFAELRANAFMGSLLVPRHALHLAIEDLAPGYGVTLQRGASLDPTLPGTVIDLRAAGLFGACNLDLFQRALAQRFGVSLRFIQVRLQRYGFLTPRP